MSVSIRSRLILLVLAVLLPGLLGLGWLIASTFAAEREAHERTLRETTRALSLVIDSELARRCCWTLADPLARRRLHCTAPRLPARCWPLHRPCRCACRQRMEALPP